MSEVTPLESGADPIEVTDVDSAAEYLFNKRTAEPEPQEESIEEIEELEAPEAELEESEIDDISEAEEESEDQEADDDDQELSFSSVDDLAEALELSKDELLQNLNVKVKADGQEGEVTLEEAIKGYQREADYTRKTEELAAKRREFETETSSKSQAIEQNLNQSLLMANAFENELMQSYQAVDWDTLKNTDQQQYIISQQEFRDRQAQIQSAKAQANQYLAQVQQQNLEEIDKKGRQALSSLIPGWESPEGMSKGLSEVGSFMKQYGFTDEEVANPKILDHRYIHIINDAMKNKGKVVSLDKKTINAKKKVESLPTLKSKARKSKATVKQQALNKLKAKVKKTGKTDDLAELLFQQRMSR